MEENLLLTWSGPALTPEEFVVERERNLAELLRLLRTAKQQQGKRFWFWQRGPKIDEAEVATEWRRQSDDFARKCVPGDELRHFRSPDDSWRNLAGREGFIIVRNGHVVEQMIVTMN